MASESDSDFEVDYIQDQRGRGRTLEYYVRWRGFGSEEDSWEPARNLTKNARKAIDDFLKGKVPAKTPAKEKKTTKTRQTSKRGATTTTTTTVTTQSEASSPEASPVMSRRSTKKVEVTETRSGSSTRSGSTSRRTQERKSLMPELRVPGFLKLLTYNGPIMVFLLCQLIIVLTFVFEKQINKIFSK